MKYRADLRVFNQSVLWPKQNKFRGGVYGYTALKDHEPYHPMLFRYADNVTYDYTVFTNEQ